MMGLFLLALMFLNMLIFDALWMRFLALPISETVLQFVVELKMFRLNLTKFSRFR